MVFVSSAKRGRNIGIMSGSASPSASSAWSSSSALSQLWFHINYFGGIDASISLKIYRRVMHHQIYVKFEVGGHPKKND